MLNQEVKRSPRKEIKAVHNHIPCPEKAYTKYNYELFVGQSNSKTFKEKHDHGENEHKCQRRHS